MSFIRHTLFYLFILQFSFKLFIFAATKNNHIMTGADLRYSIVIDKTSKKLQFIDTTNYTHTTIKGLVKVVNPLGIDVYKNVGYDANDYTLPDIDIDGGTNSMSMGLLLDSYGDIIDGEYSVYYKSEDSTIPEDYASSKKFTYCYESPIVSIKYDIKCDTSIIEFDDITNYSVTNNKITLSDYTVTRVHSVSAPEGSGFGAISDTTDKTRIFSNIWTKVWQSSVVSALEYKVDYWDANVWYTITDKVSGSADANVQCTTCSCNLRQCIINLYDKWIAALNVRAADELRINVLKVTSLYTQLLQAERCGQSTQPFCNEIAAILNSNECSCSVEGSTSSVKVVPTNSASIGSKIYIQSGVPASSFGSIRDTYIDDVTFNLYYKEGYPSTWTLKGNIKGDKGDKGDTGDNATPANFFTHEVSFNVGEVGTAKIPIFMNCTIREINGYVSQYIDASNDGKIIFQNGTTEIGQIIASKGKVYGDALTGISPVSSFTAGDYLTIITQMTAGNKGKVYLTIGYIKD